MTKPKVLISDQMDPTAEAIFRDRGCDVAVITGKTPEELKALIGPHPHPPTRPPTQARNTHLHTATTPGDLLCLTYHLADSERHT